MDDQKKGWDFHSEEESSYSQDQANYVDNNSLSSISWTGSEFVSNQKTASWYLMLAGATVIVCIIVYLFSRDILSTIFISIMGILFAVIAARPPKQLEYSIDNEGIKVGPRNYYYSDFKSFSLQHNGAIGYVSLLPLHRFRNELSIYYPPENEMQIFEALASRIPNEQRRENPIDKLAKLIRF